MSEKEERELENALSSYYVDEDQVLAIIMLKIDTKEADNVATTISQFEHVDDVFLVTGETDIIAKVRFGNYPEMKHFVVDRLGKISGVKETRTMMVVTVYKENGRVMVKLPEEKERGGEGKEEGEASGEGE